MLQESKLCRGGLALDMKEETVAKPPRAGQMRALSIAVWGRTFTPSRLYDKICSEFSPSPRYMNTQGLVFKGV